ncbi:MAG: NAD(P)/FAD-dependent oxidoreductase [Treponemataceae bacterium]
MEKYLKKLEKKIEKKLPQSKVKAVWDGRSVILSGDSPTAEERWMVGSFFAKVCKKYAAKKGTYIYKGLVNDMTVAGKKEKPMKLPDVSDNSLDGSEFDVLIIGAGVVGCAIARELSRYNISIAVLEKECDCAMHGSSRNDGMIHPGFADNPKSIKGRLNTRGNRLYHSLGKELGFETKWPGSFMLFNTPILRLLLPYMHWRAKQNGVDGDIGYRNKKTVQKMEPYLQAKHYGGFWMPSAGIASPFRVTIAFAENAAKNGVRFFFETAALGFCMQNDMIAAVNTNRGKIRTKLVINASGVWADVVAGYAGDRFFSIHPRKGMDMILDKKKQQFQNTIVGMPDLLSSAKKHSKGGGIVPCVEGNLLIGPTADEVYEREDYDTHEKDTGQLFEQIAMNSKLSRADTIAYYAGTRAANWEEDFIVEGSEKVQNFVHAAAIQSPGFASAPAIAQDIVQISIKRLEEQNKKIPQQKMDFDPIRNSEIETAVLSNSEKNALIQNDPAYGKIVCRCEQISEGEIRDAVRRCIALGMNTISIDAIKRRCRAGMGRCHGGFCTPRVMEIISKETGIPMEHITKKGGTSFILVQKLSQKDSQTGSTGGEQ